MKQKIKHNNTEYYAFLFKNKYAPEVFFVFSVLLGVFISIVSYGCVKAVIHFIKLL